MKNLLYLILLFWMPFITSAQSEVDFSKFRGESTIQFKTTEYLPNTSFCEYNIKHNPKPIKSASLPPNISFTEDSLNYFLITEKLEFDHQGDRVAIYKYFKVENGVKSKPFSLQLQKQEKIG